MAKVQSKALISEDKDHTEKREYLGRDIAEPQQFEAPYSELMH
jgi:hypothetical protein